VNRHSTTQARVFPAAFALLLTVLPAAVAQPRFVAYKSPYYSIHTDLDLDSAREATIRLTKMFEEYRGRTTAFTVKIQQQLPFHLFSRHEDYIAAGGFPGSAGVYTGGRLMATVGPATSVVSWKIVQHEGFHQFVDVVIGRSLPVWVDEGLAEYFGEAVFTGDGFVSGLVPSWRLARIKSKITKGRFSPLVDIMYVTREEWNARMSGNDYDQAWSMVHFLAHGDGGKYEQPFNGFLRDAGRTGVWDQAWARHFGPDLGPFETAWRKYWLELPDNPTANLYARATVETLTSFLARAVSRNQSFESAEAFFEQAQSGKLQAHPEDWLPQSLLASALAKVKETGTWSLSSQQRRENPSLTCVTKDGTTLIGRFTLRKDRVKSVLVETKPAR